MVSRRCSPLITQLYLKNKVSLINSINAVNYRAVFLVSLGDFFSPSHMGHQLYYSCSKFPAKLIESEINFNCYANDTQLYLSLEQDQTHQLLKLPSLPCRAWMIRNVLQLH